MKPNSEKNPANVEAINEEMDEILKRREGLIAEMRDLWKQASEEEAERPESLAPAEMRARADSIGPKIAAINTGELTPLKKRIHDAYNAASHDRLARATLKRLHTRAAEALSGFGTEGEVNLSPEHESSLLMKLRNAKTKSQRDEINAELRKIRLHRRLIEKQSETEKAQEKETPDALFKKERKRQKKRKKALRWLKKLEARGSQQSE
jgi:hypothetical protein